ncbi:Alpha/Beta hydrolase protein [Dichotomocladium elegans]|nr:Alpha/Beta hydrolase protein [Dichotomocladium elegans]
MPRLVPALSRFIPVSPATRGWDTQKLAVEKHIFNAPQKAERKVAMLWSHANGFNKEMLHPAMRYFIEHIRTLPEYDHTDFSVVLWDGRNHGDSARANEDTLDDYYQWFDHVLDTKQVIDTMGLKTDYDKLIGVSHSFGGTCMLLCEVFYPKTFDSMCVIEPVIGAHIDPVVVREKYATMLSAKRRDTWPSFDACYKHLSSNKFFKIFDPEVLELYVNYGMYETDDGTVKLKCPKEQETHNFRAQMYAQVTGYHAIATLTLPISFIYAKGSKFLKPKNAPRITSRVKQATVQFIDGTHTVPFETPKNFGPIIEEAMRRGLAGPSPSAKL